MDVTQILLIVLITISLATISVAIWMFYYVRHLREQIGNYSHTQNVVEEQEISVIFTDDFKQELRAKASARFDEVMKENALFLEQDLRLSSAQLNKHLEETLKKTLSGQLAEFQKTVDGLKDTAIKSISTTQQTIEARRAEIVEELNKQMESERQRMMQNIEKHLGEVVSRYIKMALGEGIDVQTQTDYVLKALEKHKKEIKKDIVGHVQSTE